MNRIITTALLLAASLTLNAAPIDDVKRMYEERDFAGAVEAARRIVNRSPRDANANYWLGASLVASGDAKAAVAPLTVAEDRGSTDASELLAKLAIDDYDVDKASAHLDKWRQKLTRNKRNASIPEALEQMSGRVVRLRNMLQRVERIEIIDSFSVAKHNFFESYRLSPDAGRILDSRGVGDYVNISIDNASTGFIPQSRTELFWNQPDSTGVQQLWMSGILDDGTLDHPVVLCEEVNNGANVTCPFLMPDGFTLYFASDREDGLGRYDIYMTARDDEGDFLQPQNVGLPYNSPYDDYMLAIDETSGLGWWVTDRNQIADSLTVYVFNPSQVRVNVDPEDENVAALASLSNIALTQKSDVDYAAMFAERTSALRQDESNSRNSISLELENGRIARRINDLRSSAARSAMLEYLGHLSRYERLTEELDAMRRAYRSGNRNSASEILEMENTQNQMRRQLLELKNNVVRLESGN